VGYLLSYDKTIRKLTFKFLSGGLNIKPYNKLSKEIKTLKTYKISIYTLNIKYKLNIIG